MTQSARSWRLLRSRIEACQPIANPKRDGETRSAEARNLPNHNGKFFPGRTNCDCADDVQGANANLNSSGGLASAGIPFAMSSAVIAWIFLAGGCMSGGATMAERERMALEARQIINPKCRPRNALKRANTGVAVILRP